MRRGLLLESEGRARWECAGPQQGRGRGIGNGDDIGPGDAICEPLAMGRGNGHARPAAPLGALRRNGPLAPPETLPVDVTT